MEDGLPSGDPAGEGAFFAGEFPHVALSWPPINPVLVALEKRDQQGFRSAVRQVADGAAPIAEAAPGACALFLYDLLRTAAEGLRPGRSTLPEKDRLALISVIGTATDPRTLLGVFRAEADRIALALSPGRPTQHPIAQRARQYIDAHAAEPLSLARVARELGVTRTYLSALFRRECGVTLTEYIHHVRIEHAEELLRKGGHSMATVASLAGYGSYRHFHRSFLKLRKVSPRAYVRTIGSGRMTGWMPGPVESVAAALDRARD